MVTEVTEAIETVSQQGERLIDYQVNAAEADFQAQLARDKTAEWE